MARNTAPACGLAAFLIERQNPDAVLGMFPVRSRDRRRAALPEGAAKGHRRWPPPATTWWCWALSPRAPRPATATSRPATSPRDDVGAARAAVYREAQPEPRRGVCRRGELLLELGHVPVVGAHAGQCRARAPAGDRAAAGERSPRLTARRSSKRSSATLYPKCENISVDYAVLEPRSAKGEHLSHLLLPSRGVQLERSGLVGLALRVPA